MSEKASASNSDVPGAALGSQPIVEGIVDMLAPDGVFISESHYLIGLLHGSFGLDFQAAIPINTEIGRWA